MLLNLSEYEIV